MRHDLLRPTRRRCRLTAVLSLAFSFTFTFGIALACDAPDGGSSESDSDTTSGSGLDLDDENLEWRAVTRPEEWTPTSQSEDLWLDERPTEIECVFQEGWKIEAGGVEVDTGACDYLSLSQPLEEPIEAGEPLRLTLWWQNLIAASPSEGHIAIVIDGHLLWEERVTIPSPADARDLELVAPKSAAAGSLITLHLHNHGANTWRFQGLYAAHRDAS